MRVDEAIEVLGGLVAQAGGEGDEALDTIKDALAERPRGVVAGPAGHWYALHGGELLARPMDADEVRVPQHPSVVVDGWYAPDDLAQGSRAALLAQLRWA